VGGADGALYATSDGGARWRRVRTETNAIDELAYDPDGRLLLATSGVARSFDPTTGVARDLGAAPTGVHHFAVGGGIVSIDGTRSNLVVRSNDRATTLPVRRRSTVHETVVARLDQASHGEVVWTAHGLLARERPDAPLVAVARWHGAPIELAVAVDGGFLARTTDGTVLHRDGDRLVPSTVPELDGWALDEAIARVKGAPVPRGPIDDAFDSGEIRVRLDQVGCFSSNTVHFVVQRRGAEVAITTDGGAPRTVPAGRFREAMTEAWRASSQLEFFSTTRRDIEVEIVRAGKATLKVSIDDSRRAQAILALLEETTPV
jgi:hypothetical protein